MTSQPEKLFRDKLENFQKPAPPLAWEKIEARLENPQHKGLWVKIAAGLILVSVATVLLWPKGNTNQTEVLSKTNTIVPKTENANAIADEAKTPALTKGMIPAKKTTERKIAPKKLKVIAQDEHVTRVAWNETIENDETIVAVPGETLVTDSLTRTAATSSTFIVYTAAEVNARFLKKELPAEATSEDKKSSGIQKLMGLAYDLKNNDSAFGDLRQKKNEILALNFLENKRGQNK